MQSKKIVISYDSVAMTTLDNTLRYSFSGTAKVVVEFNSLDEYIKDYTEFKEQVKNNVEDKFIAKMLTINNKLNRDNVYVSFDTYEIIYDSSLHGDYN